MTAAVVSAIDVAFRSDWATLVATLRRDLRDLDLAEEAAQEAFAAATQTWRRDGVPRKPAAWLLTTARRKALDKIRRDSRFADRVPALIQMVETTVELNVDTRAIADDRLAMIFGCCHPSLAPEAQVALTLRYVAGLTTAQIARAFLVPEATMAKRLVRAKHKIRGAGVPFAIPEVDDLAERVDAVCAVAFAIYTEGHTATDARRLVRGTLCDEAIFIAETLVSLLPDDPEVAGLAALLLLTDSRRAARIDDQGQLMLLADQDRSLWSRPKILAGAGHLNRHSLHAPWTRFRLMAAIAAVHAVAPNWQATEWATIVNFYDALASHSDDPVIRLNRAAAIAERDGPQAGLAALDAISDDALDSYHYLHVTRAVLLQRTGQTAGAIEAFRRASQVCTNETESAWIHAQLDDLVS